MDLYFEQASPEDKNSVLELCEKKDYFLYYLGFDSKEGVNESLRKTGFFDKIFADNKRYPVILARDLHNDNIKGYLIMDVSLEESFIGGKIALVYDFFIDEELEKDPSSFNLLIEQAEAAAEENLCEKLAINIPIDKTTFFDGLISLGYAVEMNRIIKLIERHQVDTKLQKKYLVRPAKETDRLFILMLTANNSRFLILPGMEDQAYEIQQRCFQSYSHMKIKGNFFMRTLIIEDIELSKPAGYIMLWVTPGNAIFSKKTAYIYDISIHKNYWGKYAVQRIMRESENILWEEGFVNIFADISENNPRPLKTAIRSLDYTLYSRRLYKKLNNTGH